MGTLDIEEVDLAELSWRLAERVQGIARAGPLGGRTAFRDAVVETLRCSVLEAEQIVDTLVARNFLVFDRGVWHVRPDAS